MFDIHHLTRGLFDNWPIWVVTLTLIIAAVIDGLKLVRKSGGKSGLWER